MYRVFHRFKLVCSSFMDFPINGSMLHSVNRLINFSTQMPYYDFSVLYWPIEYSSTQKLDFQPSNHTSKISGLPPCRSLDTRDSFHEQMLIQDDSVLSILARRMLDFFPFPPCFDGIVREGCLHTFWSLGFQWLLHLSRLRLQITAHLIQDLPYR